MGDAAPAIGDINRENEAYKEEDGQSIKLPSMESILKRESEMRSDDDEYGDGDGDGDDDVAIEQVRLSVSREDDPSLPVWTFRMWSLGLASCVLLSFLNQFFSYRAQSLSITIITIQVVSLPIGRFMAATLPNYKMCLPSFLIGKRKRKKPTGVSGAVKDDGSKVDGHDNDGVWFSLNPGPFNIKEHVLICIFANAGADFGGGSAYAVGVVNIVKALYKHQFPFIAGLLLVISSQVLGYGWAGLFRSFVVDPSHMWWPGTLPQVTLFRTLHEKEKGSRLSRNQFFITFLVASFAYYTLPGYFMPILTTFSWVCWAFPNSISLQQVGSGYRGLGLGSFSFDWAGISAFLGSPLVSPLFVIGNIAVGFFLFVYIVMPVGYWSNLYDAKKFPIYSYKLFTKDGSSYNTSFILNDHFEIDQVAYAQEGQVHLSLFFALAYGIGFANIASTVTHVICFHGKYGDMLGLQPMIQNLTSTPA